VKTIQAHENIGYHLNDLIFNGYKYIIKAQDKFLTGWGNAQNTKHIQLIACKTPQERETILQDLYNDNTFNYVNWYPIHDRKSIYNTIRNKSYTIRNDWTRCF
jgi:hypothetical protein